MDLGMQGRVVLITGGSAGIGRATAELLAREGARVAVAARGQAGLDETVTVLEGLGAEAFAFSGDLAAPGVPEAAVAATVERFGQLDALVANVGFAVSRKLADVTDADWEACFQGNLMSHIRATRAEITGVFGEPMTYEDSKITLQWGIRLGSTVATVYDWKRGEAGTPANDEEMLYNIGGNDQNAVLLVDTLIQLGRKLAN
jgi:NAD(P)-dependent dehydrogenase (short-subunit alcohol dehydrogenase family)